MHTPIAQRLRTVIVTAAAAALPLTLVSAPASAESLVEKPAGPTTAVYVEVNSNDMAYVADYTLEGSNAPVFDLAMIFAANINYNTETQSAYLGLNERVAWTLENADTQIRPLQAQGTKVLLSVLGNHQGAGFANFPDRAAAEAFAQEVADVVDKYDLDGVDLDDEWAKYGTNGTGQPNSFSLVYLVQALREKLGDERVITFYDIGPSASRTEYEGVRAGDYFDYAFQPYYGSWSVPNIPGMDDSQYSPGAINLSGTSAATAADFAQRTLDGGYGAYLTYNLTGGDQSDYISEFTRILYSADAQYKHVPDSTRPTVIAGVTDEQATVAASDDGTLSRVTANLYDATNATFLGPIGSTPAHSDLGTTKETYAWDLPEDLEPGTYTVRAAATDLAGNVGVGTHQFIFRGVQLEAAATPECIGRRAAIRVTGANRGDDPAEFLVSSTVGTASNTLHAGREFNRPLLSRSSTLPAGELTVTGTSLVNGVEHRQVYSVPYTALTCG